MDETCFSYLTFLTQKSLGSGKTSLIVPGKHKAETCIQSFLDQRKENPQVIACFVIGQKVWKSRNFFLRLRSRANLKILARGSKGECFSFNGKQCAFPFSFILAYAPPLASCQLGSTASVSPLDLTFPVMVRGHQCKALMDTGTTHSFVREKVLQGLKYNKRTSPVTLADGTVTHTNGKVDLSVRFAPAIITRHSFLVCNSIMEGIDIILGQDWLAPRHATVNVGAGKAHIRHKNKWVFLNKHAKDSGQKLGWGIKIGSTIWAFGVSCKKQTGRQGTKLLQLQSIRLSAEYHTQLLDKTSIW
jgi:hypothetical protein